MARKRGRGMKTEQEIKEHIKGLEQLLFEPTYADDTKRMILCEIQVLKEVLKDDIK